MNNNNLNKRFGPLGKGGSSGGGDNPYVLNKFKPGKKEHVLDDSLLDDATRRMLMEEIQRVPPPRMPLPQPPPSSASVGTSTTAQPEKLKDAHSGGGAAGTRANAAGPKAPPAHLHKNHDGPSTSSANQQLRGAAMPNHTSSSTVSSGVGAGDLDLLTMMTSRLKALESSQRVMQLELREKSKRVIELEDKLKASEEARKKDSDAKRGLQKELGEMLLFLTDHGLTWDGGYDVESHDVDTTGGTDGADRRRRSSVRHSNPNLYEPLGREGREGMSGVGHSKTVSLDTSDIDNHAIRKAKAPALSLLYDGAFVMPDASPDSTSTHQHACVGLANCAQNDNSNSNLPEARIGAEATTSAPPSARRFTPRLLSKIPVGVGVPITSALEKELTPNKSGRRRSSIASASSNPRAEGEDEDADGLPFDLELLKRNCLILSDHVGSQAFLGEGQQRVLMEREKVFLCIYSDGICVNSGLFRPYGWALCDAFLNDILEGYYPYEFKDRYPDGFPVEVIDRSTDKCPGNEKGPSPKAHTDKNAGMGRRLGGGNGNNAQPPSNHLSILPASPAPASSVSLSSPPPHPQQGGRVVATLDDTKKEEGTFKPMTREEFLRKLPERYVGPGGRLINIRAGVEDLGAYKNKDGVGDASLGIGGAGRILGHGLQRPTHQPSRGVYIPVRTNVERLLQQAADNKRIDDEILISLKLKENTQRQMTPEAGQEGNRTGGEGRRLRAPPLPSRLLLAKNSGGSREEEGMRSSVSTRPPEALHAGMPMVPNESRALVISAQGEIVGIGGTAPTNEIFLRTIRGQTPADSELARRHQGQSAASPATPITVVAARPRIVTLQVRMPQGQRCVLNMFETDTIADVRSEFEKAVPDFFRGCDSKRAQYELTCAFPRRVCSDHSSKLEVLGLFPNATLMVRMYGSDLYL